MMKTNRRYFLSGLLASGAVAGGFAPKVSFARVAGAPFFILLNLRGGMDGLHGVVPVGDPNYEPLRKKIALRKDQTLALDGFFRLHPSFSFLHQSFQAGEARLFHAIASPYRERSHFDAQAVLDNGSNGDPDGLRDGWLNRALRTFPNYQGLAVGQTVPLILRGAGDVTSWAPSILPQPDQATIERLSRLYFGDGLLAPALEKALETEALTEGEGTKNPRNERDSGAIAENVAALMRADGGPNIAVIEIERWDTHAFQGAETGQLATQFSRLDELLKILANKFSADWSRTCIMAVTEFGRTAAVNGNDGTDHGTGTMAMVLGGAVNGGKIVTDWPGLRKQDLYEQRDLRPTLDLRALAKGVLGDHLHLSRKDLDENIFPESSAVKPLKDIIKA